MSGQAVLWYSIRFDLIRFDLIRWCWYWNYLGSWPHFSSVPRQPETERVRPLRLPSSFLGYVILRVGPWHDGLCGGRVNLRSENRRKVVKDPVLFAGREDNVLGRTSVLVTHVHESVEQVLEALVVLVLVPCQFVDLANVVGDQHHETKIHEILVVVIVIVVAGILGIRGISVAVILLPLKMQLIREFVEFQRLLQE